jgi:superfamily II DNA or RNA helicase
MSKLILQNIIDEISFESLPANWQSFELKKFSKEKQIWDFQGEALKTALKVLWRYYEEKINYQEKEKEEINQERKKYLFSFYEADPNYPENGADYDLTKKEESKSKKLLEEFYQVENNKIGFENFINRMGFWMATGSGKTLVIVKLIEILKHLMERKEIPQNDILFLTCRDDLLDIFKEYVKEFNASQNEIYIKLKSLKEWDEAKRESFSIFKDKEITVFYYRSDNIWTEQKEKKIDFKNYENFGKWYVLLDEAHKGEKEDSIRQAIYSIFSRNGFLFNFSATFVDPRDFLTTGFNYNLQEFVEDGYGKQVYLSQEEIKAFRKKDDFTTPEKQKIVLKSLILLSYIKKFAEKIKKIKKEFYHYPLLLTLVNSVNVEDADLKLFFKEIEKIAKGEVNQKIFDLAKKELKETLINENKTIIPENEEIKVDEKILDNISYKDILNDVFNSKSPSNIEVLIIPNNRKEMIFKLRSSEKPFALIKIGDISRWIKEELEGYDIVETFDNESYFKKINRDDSDINILMGSRTFYEGWDSNRPNIILYINIGVGSKAKKFVLQSVGRGIRIEPIKNERKRIQKLLSAKKISQEIYQKIKNLFLPLETLFIFGTSASALKETINTFKEIKGEEISVGNYFEINKKAEKLPLFAPVYKSAEHILAEEREITRFHLNKQDFNLTKNYYDYLADDRIVLINYDATPQVLEKIKESFAKEGDYYKFEENLMAIDNPALILSKIINHFSLIPEKFKGFEKVERGKFIVHFERIRFNPERKNLEEFLKNIESVKNFEVKEDRIRQLQLDFENKKITLSKYTQKVEEITEKYKEESKFDGIKIKYVPNHYYYPIILSESQHKIDYLNHIITEESEVKFIKELDEYLAQEGNLFDKKFDWWLFSKLDETTDEVYIPWYNPKTEKIEHFKPDFIFWLCKGKKYYILFVDPKSITYTDYEHKVDWYKRIFEEKGVPKPFPFQNYEIKVILSLYCDDKKRVSEAGYQKYWFDNIHTILEII